MDALPFGGVGNLILFLLILNALVFIHELGHFVASRSVGVFVEEFAIGFPPRLVGAVWSKRENRWRFFGGSNVPKPDDLGGESTVYSLNALPIGGFVRPRGEDDASARDGLATASKRARIWILAAGSLFNLIFAFLVFIAAFRLNSTAVGIAEVVPNSPAEKAGLQAGDIVLSVDGVDIHYTQDLQDRISARRGEIITIVVQREGIEVAADLRPRLPEETPDGEGAMGVGLSRELPIGPGYDWPNAVRYAGEEMVFQLRQVISLPARLIQGTIQPELARPVGPVGMYQATELIVAASQRANTWFPIVQFIGLISIALGLTNLFPLPALDGGRILFVLVEAVRGRRIDPAREGLVHLAGMVVLLSMMAVITYFDIVNPIIPR